MSCILMVGCFKERLEVLRSDRNRGIIYSASMVKVGDKVK